MTRRVTTKQRFAEILDVLLVLLGLDVLGSLIDRNLATTEKWVNFKMSTLFLSIKALSTYILPFLIC